MKKVFKILPIFLASIASISFASVVKENNTQEVLADTTSAYKLFDDENKIYNYCPTIFEENGVRHIYYCTNKDAGLVYDHIGYRQGTYNSSTGRWEYGNKQYALSPAGTNTTEWDSEHVCDPSVVKGVFEYNSTTYNYLMAYLGSTRTDNMGNESGFAVSNSPAGPWVKCAAINPTLPFNEATDAWGSGQASMINLDGNGRILYFYSYGGISRTYQKVIEYDLSNLNNIKVVRTADLTMQGQLSSDYANNDCDFVLDTKNKKLFMLKSKYPYNSDGLQPDFICESLILYMMDLSGTSDIAEGIFNPSSRNVWSHVTDINSTLSGFPRNHNGGIVTDPYGMILTDAYIDVDYAVCVTSNDFWTRLTSYRIYESRIALSHGKFTTNKLNKGARISYKSTTTPSISTFRLWVGTSLDTSSGCIYMRMRNYTHVETPIALEFEDSTGYKVKPTPSTPFYTYGVDGNNEVARQFRSFGSYLMLPGNLDGYVYIPFSSLTTDESGTRSLDSLKYIYFSIDTYYDSYANYAIGDIFDSNTYLDVSSISGGSFSSRFLRQTNSSNITITRLPATDFNPNGHDLLGGIRMTMNPHTSDVSAQWILRSANQNLSGEGLYLRLKNNHFNPYYVVFYILDTNNHRMQLGLNQPIYYYDTSANLVATTPSREFGTYFYVPGSFDGFMFIPYTSLIDEPYWGGNSGTSMKYESIAHIYFGASAFYDQNLDITFGDVFTSSTYLYDGSLSKYNELNVHTEKVYNGQYVNLQFVDGYITEAEVYATDFLNATYPCDTNASINWNNMKSKYASLSASAKEQLLNANYVGKTYASCTVIEQAMWRYDLAVTNQGLENFINRVSASRLPLTPLIENINNFYPIMILVITSLVGVISITFIRRRKRG